MAALEHAVVLGGSMAGMLAAAALTRHAERVTVVERDPLVDDEVAPRKGTPQGHHPHLLLDRGRRAIDGLLPDLFEELHREGARRVDLGHEFWWFHAGRWKVRCDTPYTLSVQTRPFLEHHVRRVLRRRANVELRTRTELLQPELEQGRIRGVQLRDRQTEQTESVRCDLFVDASGRGSRSPQWLSELGYGKPDEEVTRIDLAYSTRLYRRPANAPSEWMCRVVYGDRPHYTRHGVVLTVEDDGWLFSLCGYSGDHPPADAEGFEAFARGLIRPDLYHLMRTAEPLSDVRQHKFPGQRWLRYDRMGRLPEGYAILGDAVCSFDPVFGQGMTVAAVEAELLGHHLDREGRFEARQYARECTRVLSVPWMMTLVEAFRYPETRGRKPPGLPVIHRVLDRIYDRSATDPVVYRAFLDVMQMNASPSVLLRPAVLKRLLAREQTAVDPEQPLTASR